MKQILLIILIVVSCFSADVSRGREIFKTCSGCHGLDAEKRALNKSKVIKDLSQSEIETALAGYKNGTYGGSMKGTMFGQVSKLNSDDVKSVAAYVKTLK